MKSLSDAVYNQIVSLSKRGEQLLSQGHAKEAIVKYEQALKLLPTPIHEWEAATWLFVAIGDAYWLIWDLERSYRAFQSALRCPDGIGNPFIHLRVGQIHLELEQHEAAVDNLLRAYMGADRKIFEGEAPKYFHAIEDLL